MFNHRRQWCHRTKDQRMCSTYFQKSQWHRKFLYMIRIAIKYGTKIPLVSVSCHENAVYCIQTLRVGLLPFFNSSTDFFQQDNAPIDNARITLEFLEENIIVLLKLPASSPDMSPFENIWNIVKLMIDGIEVVSEDAYWELVSQVWITIP